MVNPPTLEQQAVKPDHKEKKKSCKKRGGSKMRTREFPKRAKT